MKFDRSAVVNETRIEYDIFMCFCCDFYLVYNFNWPCNPSRNAGLPCHARLVPLTTLGLPEGSEQLEIGVDDHA